MKAEQGADSLVGRTVAQLKFDADEFDVLPPHFGPDTLRELNDRGWESILPCYGNQSFRMDSGGPPVNLQ